MTEDQIKALIERADAGDAQAEAELLDLSARCIAEMAGVPYPEE